MKIKEFIILKLRYIKNNHKKNMAYKNTAYIIQLNVKVMSFKIFIISPFSYRVHNAGEFINKILIV